MRRSALTAAAMLLSATMMAGNVTFRAVRQPAATAFAALMKKAGYNFSYDSSILRGMTVSVDVADASLPEALSSMFAGTDISYSIKGRSVILRKKQKPESATRTLISGYVTEKGTGEPLVGALVTGAGTAAATNTAGHYTLHVAPGTASLTVSYPGFEPTTHTVDVAKDNVRINFALNEKTKSHMLGEVTVEADRNNYLAMQSPSIGRVDLTRAHITSTPALFGESDVIKTLQMQPGVTGGIEGMASMYVHGGAQDENLYMLDNVPLYQVNHFGGLFSAFNTEAIKNVEFYKSSFPARYNGRLSSIMAVNTRDGNLWEHHGSFKLGLTSGAFNIDGPIVTGRTTYSFAVRRTWFDALSVPILAIYNHTRNDNENTTVARYDFVDINAKINHRFSDRSQLHAMFYYGNDYLKGGSESVYLSPESVIREMRESDISRLSWGNTVGSTGWRMQWSPILWSEITGSFVRYNSMLRNMDDRRFEYPGGISARDTRDYRFSNRIDDWSLRADFGLSPGAGHKITFGTSYTFHSFIPGKETTRLYENDALMSDLESERKISAREGSLYAGYEVDITDALRVDAGISAGIFTSSGKTNAHPDPRLSARWLANDATTIKLAYSRTSQYVHQLAQSALALPTDQWIPIPAATGPETADKISAGFYRELPWHLTLSSEIYCKWMHNLVDYRDDWYVLPNDSPLGDLLCTGSGRAYGLDLIVTRTFGRLTGHAAYSLMWSDRLFAGKNGGRRFPARFDNRHKINLTASYKFNDRWEVSAGWTGISGNRMTVATQDYELLPAPGLPEMGDPSFDGTLDLIGSINNLRLPFYHRLDLSANRHTRHGMWTFSVYNAYCNMNVIAVRKVRLLSIGAGNYTSRRYEKYRLIPILPSVSYTWFF